MTLYIQLSAWQNFTFCIFSYSNRKITGAICSERVIRNYRKTDMRSVRIACQDIETTIYKGCLLYFGIKQPVAICQLTALSESFLRLYLLRTFWHTNAICVVYSNLQDSSRPKNVIKSWAFSCNYFLQLSTWINSTTVHRWT